MGRDRVVRVLEQEGRPTKVFLSYARADVERVSSFYHRLLGRGFLPWMDVKSILAGKKWEPEIRKAIDQADFFVFFLSEHSLYREGPLHKEVKQALERQDGLLDSSIFFIVARLEDCDVISPYDKFQYVDLFKRDGFTMLLKTLYGGQTVD